MKAKNIFKLVITMTALGFGTVALAQELSSLNSDTEADRMDWSELSSKFGDMPSVAEGTSVGGVSKTLTSQYWRSLGEGYQNMSDANGVKFVYEAAQNEGDQLGQLGIAETLITQGFDALLFSPQSDVNLQPALESAMSKGIPVLNVNDAVIPGATHYVDNVRKDSGVRCRYSSSSRSTA